MSGLAVHQVYLITAATSHRKPLALRRLAEQGLSVQVEEACMDPVDPIRGCFTSHMNIWKKEAGRGAGRRILICEDDIEFRRPLAPDQNLINDHLARSDWRVLYLGHRPLQMKIPPFSPHTQIVPTSSHDGHAYILNSDYLSELIQYQYSPGYGFLRGLAAIDGILAFQPDCYALYPMLCIQDSSLPSQIDRSQTVWENPQLKAEKMFWMWDWIHPWIIQNHRIHFTYGALPAFLLSLLPFLLMLIVAGVILILLSQWKNNRG